MYCGSAFVPRFTLQVFETQWNHGMMEYKLLWQQEQPNLNKVLAESFLLEFYKLIKSLTSVRFCYGFELVTEYIFIVSEGHKKSIACYSGNFFVSFLVTL